MKISFGMIFSIILIVFFIAFAFYAIGKFLDIQHSVQTAKFLDDFQKDVDKLWQGSQGNQEVSYSLPAKIKAVCFTDYSVNPRGENIDLYEEMKMAFYDSENLFFYPSISGAGLDANTIEHIDIAETTKDNNPLCIQTEDGRVKMSIKKDFGQLKVTIIK